MAHTKRRIAAVRAELTEAEQRTDDAGKAMVRALRRDLFVLEARQVWSPERPATDVLAAAGYTHRRANGFGAHDILDAAGNVVARMTAREVTELLAPPRVRRSA